MPLATFLPFILVSIVFGYFVATQIAKSDRAKAYQNGLEEGKVEGNAELASIKEKTQAREQKLMELAKERDLERQAALEMHAELEHLRNLGPGTSGLDGSDLEALKTAFEQKTAELLRAEQAANEAFRTRAEDQIAELQTRLQAAEAASAEAGPQAPAEPGQPSGITEAEVEARIAEAVDAVRNSAAHALAGQQRELEALNGELAETQAALQSARTEVEAARQQAEQNAPVPAALVSEAAAGGDLQAAIENNGQLQSRVAELEARIAELTGAAQSLHSEIELSRGEATEWRVRCEEADVKIRELIASGNDQANQASQQAIEAARQAAQQEADQARQEAQATAATELAEALAAAAATHNAQLAEAMAAAAATHADQLAQALAARDKFHQEALEAAAAQAVPAPESAELVALRESVVRLEGGLTEITRGQNAQLAGLTQELAGLKQIAALGRAVCEGAVRHAVHAETLRSQLETAARVLLDGNTSFANDVLGPVRQLQAAIQITPATTDAVSNGQSIETLQLAIEAAEPAHLVEAFDEA